jgi:hypothetical protein
MNSSIFSENERKKLDVFLRTGTRMRSIHQLFWRIERNRSSLQHDMELLDRAIEKYRSEKRPTGPRPVKRREQPR